MPTQETTKQGWNRETSQRRKSCLIHTLYLKVYECQVLNLKTQSSWTILYTMLCLKKCFGKPNELPQNFFLENLVKRGVTEQKNNTHYNCPKSPSLYRSCLTQSIWPVRLRSSPVLKTPRQAGHDGSMRRPLLNRIFNFIQQLLKLINCAGMNDSLQLQKEQTAAYLQMQ